VPSKDVNDGFAYYLEAYDNNDNGPARSGAPELPNAVAVEEPPPTQATTVAVNAVSLQEEQLQQKNKQLEEALAQRPLPTPAPKPQESSHVLRWVMMGGAAAAAGTSLGLHFHANSLVNSINDPNYTGNKSDLQSQANTEQSASNILIGVTLAFAIGAVAFWNF